MLSDRERRILEAPNFASVATVMPDGGAHVSTVWIDLDGDDVLFNTAEGRVKTANVRRDPVSRSASSIGTIPTSRW